MRVTILAVGKIKEKYLRDAVFEYQKRLIRFCRLEIIQVNDERDSDKFSSAQKTEILSKEAARLMPHIRSNSYIIALAVNGKTFSSETFAQKIRSLGLECKSDITFIIGGSLGLSEEILSKSDLTMSFSKMTFPHQLARVILLEQIYRAFKINRNETYHK